jgi:hypothetical protein
MHERQAADEEFRNRNGFYPDSQPGFFEEFE